MKLAPIHECHPEDTAPAITTLDAGHQGTLQNEHKRIQDTRTSVLPACMGWLQLMHSLPDHVLAIWHVQSCTPVLHKDERPHSNKGAWQSSTAHGHLGIIAEQPYAEALSS